MDLAQFTAALSDLNFENTFNPYSNRCPVHDLGGAPQQRLQTLLAMLETATGTEYRFYMDWPRSRLSWWQTNRACFYRRRAYPRTCRAVGIIV